MTATTPGNDEHRLGSTRSRGVRRHRRWRAAAVVVVGLVLAAAPATAGADHARRDVKVEPANLWYSKTLWVKGSGGDTGRNGFWHQTVGTSGSRGAYAVWPMGGLRGDYRLRIFVPRDGARPAPTARAVYRVEELRRGEWVTIKRVGVEQSYQRGWRVSNSSFTLNGPVRVVARVNDASTGARSTAVLAVDTVELDWQMPHPVDRDIEADYCERVYEDTKPDPDRIALAEPAVVRPKVPPSINVYPGQETKWQKCRRLRDGKTIWLPWPWRPGSGLTDDHDSKGRAVPGRSWARW